MKDDRIELRDHERAFSRIAVRAAVGNGPEFVVRIVRIVEDVAAHRTESHAVVVDDLIDPVEEQSVLERR